MTFLGRSDLHDLPGPLPRGQEFQSALPAVRQGQDEPVCVELQSVAQGFAVPRVARYGVAARGELDAYLMRAAREQANEE